jgi:hypothetical protein
VRVRYEDVVGQPEREMRRVASAMDVPLRDDALSFIHDGEAELVAQHLVAGSRGRLDQGRTTLHRDDDWRARLPHGDRRTVEAVTWPVRRRHDYGID